MGAPVHPVAEYLVEEFVLLCVGGVFSPGPSGVGAGLLSSSPSSVSCPMGVESGAAVISGFEVRVSVSAAVYPDLLSTLAPGLPFALL
ncbi:MAG: hypothetical protein KVP17_002049 [Porospora cf. gigantea B]|uniref:uncharacterized protein n=1 Tax=Porospora cf. gigantea B TaxID=2853592 RepID=UPI003571BA0D|nr:MAG: hypothetical protein KVP17_002049 [Porospora cf. gigantea B]